MKTGVNGYFDQGLWLPDKVLYLLERTYGKDLGLTALRSGLRYEH